MKTNELPKVRRGADLACISDFRVVIDPPQEADEDLINNSESLQRLLIRLPAIGVTDCSVLITGEEGTETELVARTIHQFSHRSALPFVCIDCRAIPSRLMGLELLGCRPSTRRLGGRGRFAQAEGGSVFLQAIGELSQASQLALFQALEDFDSKLSIRQDMRLMAATHRDLNSDKANGTFLSDLFYRLNGFSIDIPSLRERKEEIPRMAWEFLTYYAAREGKRMLPLTGSVIELMKDYPWPGNVRELQKVMQRFAIESPSESVGLEGEAAQTDPTQNLVRWITGNERIGLLESDLLEILAALPGWRFKTESLTYWSKSRAEFDA